MRKSPIRLDQSAAVIVVYCEACPWWRVMRFHKDEAWDAGCAHEARVHPDDDRCRTARRVRRHADDAATFRWI